jgi:hypothetical protein
MKIDPDGKPKTGRRADLLGVRVGIDVVPDAEGNVYPGAGMSVTVDDPRYLPGHRKPVWLGGLSKCEVFVIKNENIGPEIEAVQRGDAAHHYQIEPVAPMYLDVYESAIEATRPVWELVSKEDFK